jgi:hypothetical protein
MIIHLSLIAENRLTFLRRLIAKHSLLAFTLSENRETLDRVRMTPMIVIEDESNLPSRTSSRARKRLEEQLHLGKVLERCTVQDVKPSPKSQVNGSP